ncbi:forkhead box protein G1 [Cucumis melo var. makuwa]|nr:forkhead box protein G1 [Cucumis melo var. makuwa]TYK23985.1 forkhead box protein G1 [Cucumis melo var. makuwa]
MPISFLHRFSLDPPHCRTAAKWTALLTLTAAVASFAPEFIFANATSLHSSFSRSCRRDGYIRIPLDLPGDVLCLPANMVNRSSLDFFVPTVFAALGVGVSACFVRSLGLWEEF